MGVFWSIYNGCDIGVLIVWVWGFYCIFDVIQFIVLEIDFYCVGVIGCFCLGKVVLVVGLFDKCIIVIMFMFFGVQGLGLYWYFMLFGQGENFENSKQGVGWWLNFKFGSFMNYYENLFFDVYIIVVVIVLWVLIIDQGMGDQFVNSKGMVIVIFLVVKVVYDWFGVGDKIGINVRSGGYCDMSGLYVFCMFD